MKILVIGGMHGNEMLGIDLVKSLQENPLENIDSVLANEEAIKVNKRFVKQDLNRSFPGVKSSGMYEQQRPIELLEMCKDYDIALDFHNTFCPDNDCTFVGEGANEELLAASWLLGLPRVIVADYDCINKYALNCMSIEISVQSRLNDVKIWRQKLQMLAEKEIAGCQAVSEVEKFRFVYRMTLEDKTRLNLDQANLRAFQQIDQSLAEKMGVKTPAYPIFINDKFTPYNYGGLLNKINDRN